MRWLDRWLYKWTICFPCGKSIICCISLETAVFILHNIHFYVHTWICLFNLPTVFLCKRSIDAKHLAPSAGQELINLSRRAHQGCPAEQGLRWQLLTMLLRSKVRCLVTKCNIFLCCYFALAASKNKLLSNTSGRINLNWSWSGF